MSTNTVEVWEMLAKLPEEYPGFSALPREVRYLMGCGSYEQFLATCEAIADPARFCPFCCGQENEETFIGCTDNWILRRDEFPAKGTKLMLLIVPKRHVVDPLDLTGLDAMEYNVLFRQAINHFNIAGGALAMRFGDPQFHSGTVPHLHWNVIVPSGNIDYRIALAKDDEARVSNYARLLTHRAKFAERAWRT